MFEKLSAPFSQEEVSWRVQRAGHSAANRPWAIVVPYLDARAIQNRLDQVVGPENWQTRIIPASGAVLCELSVRISDGTFITKTDGSELTDIEGFKGACSRALVRAAVQWGIGRYLYEMPTSFARFVSKETEGANRIEIDGQTYFWVPGVEEAPKKPEQAVSVAPPVPGRMQDAPPVPGRSSGLPRVLTAKSTQRGETNEVVQSAPQTSITQIVTSPNPPGDAVVPFGQTQGKRLLELTDSEVMGLKDFYDRVPNPVGKAKSFKKIFEVFLAARRTA